MDKKEIVAIFEDMADLLELKGENPFKIRAYRYAARSLLNLEKDIHTAIADGSLVGYPYIGESLLEKITLLSEKGRFPEYEKLKKSFPSGLIELLSIPGIGPKKVQHLYKKLHIHTILQLRSAAKKGEIAKLAGFGKKSEQNILEAINQKAIYEKRHLWWDAKIRVEKILNLLCHHPKIIRAEIAGSVRRKLETIGDLDFLVSSSHPKIIANWFTSQSFVKKVLAKGTTKCSVLAEDHIQIDLRIVPDNQFVYALAYFTGSKEHNIQMREMAIKKGWSLSEYGLEIAHDKKKALPVGKKIKTEEDLYRLFDMQYIPPEIRENLGEIPAALTHHLPKLVELKDIRGSFHNHTTETDGRSTLDEMIQAAEDRGYEYFGISDHSQSDFQAGGMNEERLLKQLQTIRNLNRIRKYKPFLFAGIECNVLPNGSLDFSDDILKQLDYVIVSIHSSLQQDEKTMTQRLIRAIEHPSTTMIGHVTGRLLLERAPYAINMAKVIDACIANKKIMEINGNPKRMDMDWRYWHAASKKGLLACVNADAHAADQLDFIESGINVARKGWLEKHHVINTQSLDLIKKRLKKMHP